MAENINTEISYALEKSLENNKSIQWVWNGSEWIKKLIDKREMTGNYITPQMFGAKGDGVTDDTEAIEAAFNAVNTAGGGIVYFPKGTYIVSSVIHVYGNTAAIAEKGQAIIKVIDSWNIYNAMIKVGGFSQIVSNVVFDGLIFRGTETFGSAQGGVSLLDFWSVTNVSITNCLFQNNMYAAIRLINNTSNVRVFSCRFEALDCGIVSLGHIAVNDVTVRNCHFTGVSSLNSFTNSNSEQVGLFTDPDAGVSYRWVVEDCVFEYKGTNVIAFNVHNAPSDDTILIKDCVARNCTFRYCLGGVLVYHSENVLLDGLFFDDTPNNETTPFGFLPYRMIHVTHSKNVTIRNVTSDSTQIRYPIQVEHSSDVLIEAVDTYVDAAETSGGQLPFANLNTVSKLIMRGFHFKPISNEKVRAIIQMTALTDSYVDLHGDAKNGSEVQLFTLDRSGLSGNTFVFDTDNTIVRNFSTALISTADPNTYEFIGNTPYIKNNITEINRYIVYRRWDIQIDNQSRYNASLAVTDFNLLNDGAELLLEFKSTAFTAGKTFKFNKTGNIIPIDKPFTFSDDYVVVCKFVQKNAKWVEVQRTLEYYEGATITVSDESRHYDTMPSTADLFAMPNNTVFDIDGYWTDIDGHGGKYKITKDYTSGALKITDGTKTLYLVALNVDGSLPKRLVDPTRYGVRGTGTLNTSLTLGGSYATQNSNIMSRIINPGMNATIKFPKGNYVFESPLNISGRQLNLVGDGHPVTRTAALSLADYEIGTTLCFPFLKDGQTAISMTGGSNIENLAIYGNKDTYSFVIDRTKLTTEPEKVVAETIAENEGKQIKCKAIAKAGGGFVKNVFVFNFYTGITCSGNTFIKDFYARQVHYGINCTNDTKMEGIGGFDVHTLIRITGSLCSVSHERVDSCVHALEITNGGAHTITDVDGDWCTDSLIAIGDGETYGTVSGVIFDGVHGRCNTLKSYDTTKQTAPVDVRNLANIDGYGLIRVYARAGFRDSRIVANSYGGGNPMDGSSTYLMPDILFTFSSRTSDVLDNITFVLAKGVDNIDDVLRVIQTRNGFTARVEDPNGDYFIDGNSVIAASLPKGKAVVIGDSYFDGDDNYNFANHLRSKNLYKEVIDYAEGGTGFGKTYKGHQTLYEKLQNAQMRADIAEADVVYMHLGGNDFLSKIEGVPNAVAEPDFYLSVKNALDELYVINPNATIYYIPAMLRDDILNGFISYAISGAPIPFGDQTHTLSKVNAVKLAIIDTIINLSLAVSPLNIFMLDTSSHLLIRELADDHIHPTPRAAEAMFDAIINGNYNRAICDHYFMSQDAGEATMSVIVQVSATFIQNIKTILSTGLTSGKISKTTTQILTFTVNNVEEDEVYFFSAPAMSLSNRNFTTLQPYPDLDYISLISTNTHPYDLTVQSKAINIMPLYKNTIPDKDGTYKLKVEHIEGKLTYSWVAE